MKVNKKILTMIIGTLMIGSMVVGCEKKENKVEETQTQQQTQVEEKKEPAKEEINKVMYDKENIKITCTSIEKDDRYAMPFTTVTLKIENNRDEEVTVQNDSEITINDDVVIGNSFSEDLPANESKEVELVFYDDTDFKEKGIEELEKMQMNLMVLHNEYNLLTEDVITLDLTK